MAVDYWEPTEMEEANMSMDELYKRRFTPMVCGKCLGSHRTVDCGVAPRCDKMREDEENLSMEELFRRSIRVPLICGECGDPHKTTTCTNIQKPKNGAPKKNWTMLELEDHYSSSRKACEFLGYPQESQSYTSRDSTHFPWSENMSYHYRCNSSPRSKTKSKKKKREDQRRSSTLLGVILPFLAINYVLPCLF